MIPNELVKLVLTILAGIKAGKRGPKHLHEVAHASQVLVHVPEVSVDVVSVPGRDTAAVRYTQPERILSELLKPSYRHAPVQGIVLHAKVVSGEVTRRVAQVVILVPQHPLTARGCRYNLHLDGKLDCGNELPAHLRLQQVREQVSAGEPAEQV